MINTPGRPSHMDFTADCMRSGLELISACTAQELDACYIQSIKLGSHHMANDITGQHHVQQQKHKRGNLKVLRSPEQCNRPCKGIVVSNVSCLISAHFRQGFLARLTCSSSIAAASGPFCRVLADKRSLSWASLTSRSRLTARSRLTSYKPDNGSARTCTSCRLCWPSSGTCSGSLLTCWFPVDYRCVP